MRIDRNPIEYEIFRDKVKTDNLLAKNMAEVIQMDVQRSFTNVKTLDPVALCDVLKTYAFFNPEVEYCQGMNFVAGLLLLYFKEEKEAFKSLQQIIESFDMGELFNNDLHKLKQSFYIFDRMLSIRLPKLHAHF